MNLIKKYWILFALGALGALAFCDYKWWHIVLNKGPQTNLGDTPEKKARDKKWFVDHIVAALKKYMNGKNTPLTAAQVTTLTTNLNGKTVAELKTMWNDGSFYATT